MTYQIAKRAFGQYTVVETGIESWLVAEDKASKLQAANNDGEYFTFRDDETPASRPSEYCAVQAAFAYL